MKTLPTFLSGGLLLALAACNNANPFAWRGVSYDEKVVWAEDASALAVARLSYEERQSLDPLMGTTDKRNFRHQIFLQQADGGGRSAVTPPRPYQVGALYYLKQPGYLLVQSLLPSPAASRFDRIDLRTGRETPLLEVPAETQRGCATPRTPEGPQPARVDDTLIPSPDGALLAFVRSPECGVASVEFRQADTLAVFGAFTLPLEEPMQATWHPGNYLVLAGSKQAWRFDPGQSEPVPTPPPHCLEPPTRSSDITPDGRLAVITPGGVAVQAGAGRKGFGCQ